MDTISILLMDNDETSLGLTARVLRSHGDITIAGSARSGAEGVELAAALWGPSRKEAP